LAVENVGNHHGGTFRSESAAVRRADMARTACDDGDLSRKPHNHPLE
jgi:hypothetical protein